VMGGDLGPQEVIAGVALAVKELGRRLPEVILVGNESQIQPLLKEYGISDKKKISVMHASEVIEMDDKPIQALKAKKDSSMVRALELVKDGKAQAVLSCGNTGSLMAGGTIKLRTLSGVERPALASIVPSCDKRHFVLIDGGANPEPTAEQMAHNAVLGNAYYRAMFSVDKPRVGLLTIGTEEGKGVTLTRNTHELLKQLDGLINYLGLIEGFQLFNNEVDVVVCDGFVGNVLLKSWESMIHAAQKAVKEELSRNFMRKIAAILFRGSYYSIKNQFDPDRYGAVPLLGLTGMVLKAHGSSNRMGIKNAIKAACTLFQHEMDDQIAMDIEAANQLMRPQLDSENPAT